MAIDWAGGLQGGLTSGIEFAKWLVVGVALVIMIVMMMDWLKYNKKVLLSDETSHHNIVKFCRAKLIKDKDQTYWWDIRGRGIKKKWIVPPKEAIDVTAFGKEFARCTLTKNGDIIWDVKGITSTKGLTSQEKMVLANEFESSEEWSKANGGLLAFLNQNAGLIGLIIIFTLMLTLGGDAWAKINQPAVQITADLREVSKSFEAMAQIQSDTNNRVRRIEAEVNIETAEENNLPIEPPN